MVCPHLSMPRSCLWSANWRVFKGYARFWLWLQHFWPNLTPTKFLAEFLDMADLTRDALHLDYSHLENIIIIHANDAALERHGV